MVPAALLLPPYVAVKNHVADATMQNSVVLSSLLCYDEFSNPASGTLLPTKVTFLIA